MKISVIYTIDARTDTDQFHLELSVSIKRTFFLHVILRILYYYSKLAKIEKLKPMELELKKLEDLSEAIVNDFAYMRAREEEMRDTNGKRFLNILDICDKSGHLLFYHLKWN